MNTEQKNQIGASRPPIVVVMGHIDHGKSTLLDYIRKTNIVEGEAGGITQHLSAYVALHKDNEGHDRSITFLDTPGHEAFSMMRERGALAADIAILVVSAEDSVKAQTLEAMKTIQESKLPYIVAINKIDKPGANPEKTKMDLSQHGVYLEGSGGDVPFAEISAKHGTNIDHLLELVLLVADLSNISGNAAAPAEGIVIESHLDQKRGITATLIVKNGTLKKGMSVVSGSAMAQTRIMEDFLGRDASVIPISSPVRVVGFSSLPLVGSTFTAYESKKEAEQAAAEVKHSVGSGPGQTYVAEAGVHAIPLIIKTDFAGTGDAVVKEVTKLELPNVKFKVISRDVGAITENDIKMAASDKDVIVIGFNVKMDARARDLAERDNVTVATFDIIYKIADFLKEEVEKQRPRIEMAETIGKVKILKVFGRTKERQVVGGRVTEGQLVAGAEVKIIRREAEIGQAKIVGLEQGKQKAVAVLENTECGILIESRIEIAAGDILEAFQMMTK